MNKTLLTYIKELSRKDTKTFSQKVLKLFEEGGELAKKALPYDDAFATRHRFTSRDAILEEVADVILVALSIGYDLGMDDDDLEAMISTKTKYWDQLQSNETNVKTLLPYEIHITVQYDNDMSFDRFKDICKTIDVKPLLIANYSIEDKRVHRVMMTSAVVINTAKVAQQRMADIVTTLKDAGYLIIRQKIETVPWHPASNNIPKNPPQEANVFVPVDKSEIFYFENHMNVRLKEDPNCLGNLVDALKYVTPWVHTGSFGISWNVNKTAQNGHQTFFVTYRCKFMDRNSFSFKAKNIADRLRNMDGIVEVSSENIEFSVYDSAEVQDNTWLMELDNEQNSNWNRDENSIGISHKEIC